MSCIVNSFWHELKSKKIDFLTIVRILNRFYSYRPPKKHPSPSFLFRERLVYLPENDFRVFIKKLGNYEYLVYVDVIAGPLYPSHESWVHIDGIKQEREELTSQGVKNSPIFNTICMTDLFETACEALPELNIQIEP